MRGHGERGVGRAAAALAGGQAVLAGTLGRTGREAGWPWPGDQATHCPGGQAALARRPGRTGSNEQLTVPGTEYAKQDKRKLETRNRRLAVGSLMLQA